MKPIKFHENWGKFRLIILIPVIEKNVRKEKKNN